MKKFDKSRFALKVMLMFCVTVICHLSSVSQTPYFKRVLLNIENSDIKFSREITDHRGMLWFGSSSGLIEYDGLSHTLHAFHSNGFDNSITALYEDKGDTIWVGYKSGNVAFLKGRELTLFKTEEGMPGKPITAISKDMNGNLWIGTAGEGVYYHNGKRLFNINMDDGLNDNYTYAFAADPGGDIWVGTDEGLALCGAREKQKVLKTFRIAQGLPDNIVSVIKPAGNGDLWIGLQQKGVCKFIAASQRFVIPPGLETWKFGQVSSICQDQKGLWIGTEEAGLIYISDMQVASPVAYGDFSPVRFTRVSEVIMDKEGNIWMVANSNIYQSTGRNVMFMDKIQGVDLRMIHTLMVDSKDRLWFTPDQGLVAYSLNKKGSPVIKKFTITPPQELIDIVSLYEDDCGYTWIGTMGAGIYRLNSESGHMQKIDGNPILKNASVMSIAGNGKTIFVATFSGALKITIPEDCHTDQLNTVTESLEKESMLGNYYIYDVYTDSRSRTWFATDGKGITCLDQGRYVNYNGTSGIRSKVIYSITEDELGNIWFSTQEHGLYKFNGNTFINYNDSDGLSSLSLSGIISDRRGSIIAVHNHGFDVLNINTGNFKYYGPEIGFSDINSDLTAISKEKDGHVWIGTDEKILRYYNVNTDVNTKPITLITKASLFSNEIRESTARALSYNQNYLSFDFIGLWYTNPGRVKFRYMLEGYNKEWINTLDRNVIFPRLEPGKYKFIVRSSLNQHFREYSEATFAFTIRQPVWRESWFIFMVSIGVVGLVYFLAVMRIRQIRKLEELKKEKINFQFETLKSQVNPHFLFNSFNTLITVIDEDKKNAIEFVETLSSFFRNIVTFKDLDLITLEEELGVVSVYFYLQQKRFGSNLRLSIQVEEQARKKRVPPMVLQILMENAVKHNAISSETPLSISIISYGETLELKNNLNIKRTKEDSTKTGLQNIINRFRLLTDKPVIIRHTATEFTVTIPLV